MKVLVTGGTGFLGTKLAARLKYLGFDVTAIGRNEFMGEKLQRLGITFIKANIQEAQQILEVCKSQDYVFHCAALSSPWGKFSDFYNNNVIGTRNVIAGCKKHHVKRLIHVSTPSIYFNFKDRWNVSENDPLPKKPVNMYAKTKLLAEQEIDKAYQEGLSVITIRPRGLFGPGDTAVFPRLLKANAKGWLPVIGDGKFLVDITYVENVVDALLLCMDSPESTCGQKYNITNGEAVYFMDSVKKLLNMLGYPFKPKYISARAAYCAAGIMEFLSRTVLLGKEPVLTRYTLGIFSKSMTLDISAAREKLGYIPNVSIDEGLEAFAKWWKDEIHGS